MRRSLGALGALGSLSARKVGLVASPDEARSASVADDDADRGVGAMCVRALDDGSEELVVLRGDGVVVRWSIGDDLANARVAAIHEARAGEPGGLGALFGTPGAGGASATWAPSARWPRRGSSTASRAASRKSASGSAKSSAENTSMSTDR